MRLSSAKTKSTIVLINPDSRLQVSTSLSLAQGEARKNKLPLAVVVRHDPMAEVNDARFDELEKLERQLAYYQIPLILMFGSLSAVLRALQKHFEPDIYESDDAPGALTRHEIKWPWTVQSVTVLRRYISKVGVDGVCEL